MSDPKRREELLAEAKRIKREKLLAEAKRVQAERQKETQAIEADRPGMLESAVRGAAQGLGGLADEAYGVVGAIVNPTDSDKGFMDRYRDSRDYARRRDAKAQAANPKTFAAAQVGTGVGTALVPGLNALNVGKGAKLGEVALKGAAGGGITGFGLSEADVTKGELPEALVDTAKGASLGAAGGAAIHGASKALSPKLLKHLAERRAAKAALGNQQKPWDVLERQGRVNQVGRDLLDDGVVKFGSSARGIADRAAKKMDDSWRGIEDALGQVDKATPNSVRGADIAQDIVDYAAKIEAPHNEALVENLLKQAQRYEQMGDIPLAEAQRLKNLLKFDARDPAAMPIGKEATNALKRAVGNQMEKGVERHVAKAQPLQVAEPVEQFAEMINTGTGRQIARSVPISPVFREATLAGKGESDRVANLLRQYQDAKKKYGNMASVQEAAEKLANRQEKNQTLGLGEKVLMAGELASGNPFAWMRALATGIGAKAIKERGSSMAAVSLDKVSKMLAAGGEGLGRFREPLAKAARNGNLGAAHLILMRTQPEYRELVRQQLREKKESP